jgi:SAM-dependent methyltransferase
MFMKRDEAFRKIAELDSEQAWIYRFVLPNGLTTPGPESKGEKNVEKTRVIQSLNLKGKNVLDVGCAEGMFSFYMAAAGAQVTGIEVNKNRLKKAEFIKNEVKIEGVNFVLFDAEIPSSWDMIAKKFDVGFCFSVLHRVSDPFNLIAQLSSKCETLVFEWKAPEGFLSNRISMAFHEVEGKLDPRNIKSRVALTSDIAIMDTGEEKPYWCPTVGAIKEITSSFGFDNFKVIKVTKFSLPRVIYAYFDLFTKLFLKRGEPISWRRYQRVMLICSRKSLLEINLNPKINRLPWDGTLN